MASRLAVVLACVYAVLVLIVLVNLLIAIVDETYGTVKESEADQMLRNKALIIDEIESTLTDAVIEDLNSRYWCVVTVVASVAMGGPPRVSRRTSRCGCQQDLLLIPCTCHFCFVQQSHSNYTTAA